MKPVLVTDRVRLYLGDSADAATVIAPESIDAIVTDPPAGIAFMGRDWDSDKGGKPYPSGFPAWLAGFIDGEGNFDIHRQSRSSGVYYYCRFELSLRADDGGILQMLQRTLGGKVYYGDPSPGSSAGSSPRARWELVSREECLRLATLLDAFPLQTKKARDFAIWREALAASVAHAGASRVDLMSPLWDALRGTRPFAGAVTAAAEFQRMSNEHAWIAWLAGILRSAMALLKPGGHALVWALPRTSHWTATSVEDAGFEVRDVVTHLFGTGFPKSLNVSKAIDARVLTGSSRTEDLRRVAQGDGYEPSGRGRVNYDHGSGSAMNGATIAGGVTEDGASASGVGTALKPAAEMWILARKPLSGTVAETFMAHGTGGLRIDDCRIGHSGDIANARSAGLGAGYEAHNHAARIYGAGLGGIVATPHEQGRWPANLVLSHMPECGKTCAEGCAVAALDEQSGLTRDGVAVRRNRDGGEADPSWVFNMRQSPADDLGYGGEGGASRFFYCAKPSRSEKDAGLDHLPIRTGGEATDREEGSAGLSNPRAGAGRTGGARNHHPTVKSIDLMRYLCRLVTPKGGTVLDLFAGSGTTGVAALQEGLRFVGIEREPEYADVAAGRLAHVECVPVPERQANDKPTVEKAQPSLFDAIGGR